MKKMKLKKMLLLTLVSSMLAFTACEGEVEETKVSKEESTEESKASESSEETTEETAEESTEESSEETTEESTEESSEEPSTEPEEKPAPEVNKTGVELSKKDAEKLVCDILDQVVFGKGDELTAKLPEGVNPEAYEMYAYLTSPSYDEFEIKEFHSIYVVNINDPEELQEIYKSDELLMQWAFPNKEDYDKIEAIATVGFDYSYVLDGEDDRDSNITDPEIILFYEDGEWKYLIGSDLTYLLGVFHVGYATEDLFGGNYEPVKLLYVNNDTDYIPEIVPYEEGCAAIGIDPTWSISVKTVKNENGNRDFDQNALEVTMSDGKNTQVKQYEFTINGYDYLAEDEEWVRAVAGNDGFYLMGDINLVEKAVIYDPEAELDEAEPYVGYAYMYGVESNCMLIMSEKEDGTIYGVLFERQ